MKTLLAISSNIGFASAVRTALSSERYRLLHQPDVAAAAHLLRAGAIDLALIEADLVDVRPVQMVRKLQQFAPDCPIILVSGEMRWEWEEKVYLEGVRQILRKPLRNELLRSLVDRYTPEERQAEIVPQRQMPPAQPQRTLVYEAEPAPGETALTLRVLRDFTSILTHSLDAPAMLEEFLKLLREILGVNRAAIFLKNQAALMHPPGDEELEQNLEVVCWQGMRVEIPKSVPLSLSYGIGAHLQRHGRILLRDSHEAQRDGDISREFSLMGASVAVPLVDRESLIGAALFDDRLTGHSYTESELTLIFHLLESVGLAIRNTILHEQVLSSHTMLSDIIGQLTSGCIVIEPDTHFLHLNPAARELLDAPAEESLEFLDLPKELSSEAYRVIRGEIDSALFDLRIHEGDDGWREVHISPFRSLPGKEERSVIVIIHDLTPAKEAERHAVETERLRLMRQLSEQVAHEIGNALVPLSTHQQLLASNQRDAEFLSSLASTMGNSVRRIARFSSQMMYLAREEAFDCNSVVINDLIAEAFQEARSHFEGSVARLDLHDEGEEFHIQAEPKAMRFALAELLLNALQANTEDPAARVEFHPPQHNGERGDLLQVDILDYGDGFAAHERLKGVEPFFSTRNVGLGLGLTVAERILRLHGGRLDIRENLPEHKGGCVTISCRLSAGDGEKARRSQVNPSEQPLAS